MTHHTDMLKLMQKGLESKVKKILTERMVSKHMESYEKDLRAEIKSLMDEITMTEIRSLTDMMRLKEEINITIKWDEDNAGGGTNAI